ncbi:MAG: glycosyltransferase family 4 protein [Phycisphaerae bacterium]|nr:glycosyltransferase family 4 protein [Phycisphaerae bacterium]
MSSIGARPLPITIQLANPDSDCRSAVMDLQECGAPDIRLNRQPLTPSEFRGEFHGAIVLLLHRADQYQGRASGLFLDSIMAGAPIIAVAGSRFAEEVEADGIGVVAVSTDPSAIHDAAVRAVAGWRQHVKAMSMRRERLLVEHRANPLAHFIAGT